MTQENRHTIALFGEAEKGPFKKALVVYELPQLVDTLGNPPADSSGLFFAVQALLFQRKLIYFRVKEEGFSSADYFYGFKALKNKEKIPELHAICIPGVGEPQILDASRDVCDTHKSFLITTQKDLYDYLTAVG